MKSDFSIGDHVQMSALGAARCPRHADKIGTIVGRSIYVNCARVLLDGNKSPISVHCDFLDAILPVKCSDTTSLMPYRGSLNAISLVGGSPFETFAEAEKACGRAGAPDQIASDLAWPLPRSAASG